jgi:hypothetical protein
MKGLRLTGDSRGENDVIRTGSNARMGQDPGLYTQVFEIVNSGLARYIRGKSELGKRT